MKQTTMLQHAKLQKKYEKLGVSKNSVRNLSDLFYTNKAQQTALQFIRLNYAERTRFELVVGLLLRQFSKLVVSATHPPLLVFCRLPIRLAALSWLTP